MLIWIVVGVVGAIAGLAVLHQQPDRKLPRLAMGLAITACVYVGFAIVGNASFKWVAIEFIGVGWFSLLALLGMRYSIGWLLAGWLLHPVWDLFLHQFESGASFTPDWYPIACVVFDLVVALYIAGEWLTQINFRRTEHDT